MLIKSRAAFVKSQTPWASVGITMSCVERELKSHRNHPFLLGPLASKLSQWQHHHCQVFKSREDKQFTDWDARRYVCVKCCKRCSRGEWTVYVYAIWNVRMAHFVWNEKLCVCSNAARLAEQNRRINKIKRDKNRTNVCQLHVKFVIQHAAQQQPKPQNLQQQRVFNPI